MSEDFKYLNHEELTALSEDDRQAYYQEESAIRTAKNFQLFMEECKKEGLDTSKWKIYTGSIGEMFDDIASEEGND